MSHLSALKMKEKELPPQPARRNFFKEVASILIGAVVGLIPMVAGLAVYFDPLRRKSKSSSAIKVASLNALAEDGIPRKFSVVTTYTDAWNKFPPSPIGAVYLRRVGIKVQAFNVTCPHAGCFVDYVAERKGYLCPCHNSTFALDGSISDRSSPSPRGLDELDVEIRNGSEVWVKFQNYRAGEAKKIPA